MARADASPMMIRRPDRRLEVRHGDVVLMESMDRGPIVRVEAYRIDGSGLELFQGYLGDAGTPDRVALLRLWVEAGAAMLAEERRRAYERALRPLRVRRFDLETALWRVRLGGVLHPVVPEARA